MDRCCGLEVSGITSDFDLQIVYRLGVRLGRWCPRGRKVLAEDFLVQLFVLDERPELVRSGVPLLHQPKAG